MPWRIAFQPAQTRPLLAAPTRERGPGAGERKPPGPGKPDRQNAEAPEPEAGRCVSANKRAQPRFTPPAGIKAPQGGQARAAGERGAKRAAAKKEIFAAAGV